MIPVMSKIGTLPQQPSAVMALHFTFAGTSDALQEVVRKELTGWYWIDSICINQSDMAEREAQAMIMGDIFASAEEVVC